VDDTLLAYAREHGVDERLQQRMTRYFEAAQDAGADAVLNACSSVGETVDVARSALEVPILKIDEPMAEAVAARATDGTRIAVLATVQSTLGPTCRLLQSKLEARGVQATLTPQLCDGAFDLLVAGKRDEHDLAVSDSVRQAAAAHDLIVFAQASMARLAAQLENENAVPLFSSPHLAFEKLAAMRG
jgi:aspartate/glutamate racemase